MNLEDLDKKKAKLDALRPLPPEFVKNLDEWFSVELTVTSNALEGNTLTRQETAVVVEKGLTVRGKPLKDHLEATNHNESLEYVKTLVSLTPSQLTENHIFEIHKLILKGIDDDNAGKYRRVPVRISGSTVIFPNPVKVPDMMNEFVDWLQNAGTLHPAQLATEAHYKLVTIHPFVDGNGRTARLLMNLLLMMLGYPPAIIKPEIRIDYIDALEKAQLGGSLDDFTQLIYLCIDSSLDIYLNS